MNKSKEVRITREILFRAKRIDNGEWVEGFYLPIRKRAYIICEAETECVDGENTDLHATEWYEVDPETICQYTDSIAIGGKRIWENDFVENDGAIGIVKFGKYGNGFHLGFYINWINCPHLRNEICFWESNVRVIGNIFDNPEIAEEITDGSD